MLAMSQRSVAILCQESVEHVCIILYYSRQALTIGSLLVLVILAQTEAGLPMQLPVQVAVSGLN